jgi:hypothetical protein
MPQEQERYHTNRVHPDETHAAEMDELVDQAIAETAERDGAVTAADAADWLDSIDDALDEWAETAELAAQFVASYQQKGGE